MGYREYARHRGVSLATIQRKIKRGLIPTVTTGSGVKIPQKKADQLWEVLSSPTLSIQPVTNPTNPHQSKYQKAKADIAELKLQITKTALKKKREQLLDANEVQVKINKISEEIKSKFNELSVKIAPRLLAAKNLPELTSILSTEIEKTLSDLGKI